MIVMLLQNYMVQCSQKKEFDLLKLSTLNIPMFSLRNESVFLVSLNLMSLLLREREDSAIIQMTNAPGITLTIANILVFSIKWL